MFNTEAHLDSLPEELILLILDHLDLSNLHSLHALNQTSQRLHRLTSERLYHCFPGRNSELFLRTIAKASSLASHVKQAVWHQERKTNPRLHVIEKAHIVRKLHQLAVPQQGTDLAEQFAKFGKNDDYWYMEVLLLFMPNLESLTIRDSWLWDDHHYWFKSLSPFFNPLCNSQLKTATLYGPLRIENIVPLLTIPSLRTLSLTQVIVMRREGYRVFQWSVWPVDRLLPVSERNELEAAPSNASNLEHLTLNESYIDLDYLLPVLRGIKALKSFTYSHRANDLADEAHGDHINKTALSQICTIHNASLTSLCIRDTQPWHSPSIHETPQTTSALHTLAISPFTPPTASSSSLHEACAQFLDALPLSLAVLRLGIAENKTGAGATTSQGDYHAPALSRFLEALAPAIAPSGRERLREVALCEWPPTLGWFPDNLGVLQEVWRGLGLRLVSEAGAVEDFYEAEPLCVDDEGEAGWVVVTDLGLWRHE